MNIIEAWLASETSVPGRTITAALRDLSDEVGQTIRSGRLSEWRRGLRTPSPRALRYMVEVCIERVLCECLGEPLGTYTDAQLDALARALTPPERAGK